MNIMVVAPHADDELLGCGGALLRWANEGATIGWLLMTSMRHDGVWSESQVTNRQKEIADVCRGLSIKKDHFFSLGLPTSSLDVQPMSDLVASISSVFAVFKPSQVLLPFPGDIHSDHRVAFEAASACTKWFRYSSIKRVLAYETLSETDFSIDPRYRAFQPNVFVDISSYLDQKLSLLSIYESEMGSSPFPRSEETVRALSVVRGSQAGFRHAEAFYLVKESQ